MHFLGLDIGTSAVKAVLVDDRQAVVAEAARPLSTDHPRPGWSEQDPEIWSRACVDAVAAVRARAPHALADVHGVGLSGQMHGAVVLGEGHRPLRPAILWNDSRAVAECAALSEAVPAIATIAGVPPMPGFTAPKLLWLSRHEPEVFRRTRHVLLAKDYVRLMLTGETATDMCDAAGTLMLDEAARAWSEAILAAVGVDREQMPRLGEGSASSGTLRPEVAAAWGIDPRAVVAFGGGDIAAGAVGIGAVEAGDGFISLGTSAQIFFCSNGYRPKPETLIHAFAHAVPERWFEMAALLNGAGCLDWVARLLGRDPGALLGEVEARYRGPSPIVFLPYLAGERTPHNDPDAAGAFAGLDHAAGHADLVQAVLEGVAFSLRDGFNAFAQVPETESVLPVIGGGSRSRFWLQVMATVLGRPLGRMAAGETGPATGAARLARLAVTGEPVGAVCTQPAIVEIIEPDRRFAESYEESYARFRTLYRSLRGVRAATADRLPAAKP